MGIGYNHLPNEFPVLDIYEPISLSIDSKFLDLQGYVNNCVNF